MNKKWLIIGTISFSVGFSLSLVINRDIKQAALTGLLSVSATFTGVSITESQRRQKLDDKISTQQKQLQGLVQKETDFNNSIALLFNRVESLKQQEETIKAVIETLKLDHQQYLQLATRSQSEIETIQNQIYELNNCKSSLEPEIIILETKLRQLQEQEKASTKLLADLSNSKQQIEVNLESDRHSHQQLQEQKFNLEENIKNLAKQKQTLAEQLNSQQYSLNQLQQQKLDLENAITTIYTHKQEIDLSCATSQTKLNQLQNLVLEQQRIEQLEEELANLRQQLKLIQPDITVPGELTPIDWADPIEDANIKKVLIHLDRHNSLTEAELNQMLGSPRKARSFDVNYEQYLPQVPFSVRVETTSNGKRYVKY